MSRSMLQPDELKTPSSISQLLGGTDPIAELGIALFEIKDIPGKGKGLVAHFNIPQGTRIICEKPLLRDGPMPRDELEGFLGTKLKAMSKESQRQFLSLHNSFPAKKPFSGIFRTNALPCGSGSSIGGVYPTSCLINHSCMPNAHNNWNSDKEHETIHAIRSIERGAEITISYDHGGTSSERQAFLKESFGFSCTCSCCALPPLSLQASDNRRTQIQNLDYAIGNPFRMESNPQESLRDCYSLIQVLDQEFDGCAGALILRLYYDAFQISIAHGDQARASIFAERAYKARVICEGEDSPETLRAKSFALKPAVHGSFEVYSRKWKSVRDSASKGLDTDDFDKWLFRQKS
ncbi:putative set domain-containing protein 5 protein [Botrytis cinerea BcDW1]|uniref:Putative set domain-containing protein 5 protein n=1 Tax=Botryotinia fuckeliana (strain BcDW1) TaxID=1290391 RepID=M7UB99_BOTF1|nr:putative set domain-containing protein 5 protein [Botrytis cinerea BcDW1]